MTHNKTKLNVFLEYIKIIIYAFFFSSLIKIFFFENFYIPSSSMEPSYIEGDRLIASKFKYGYTKYSSPIKFPIKNRILYGRKIKRGDIIVFYDTKQGRKGELYIKRVIGLPGDHIKINDKNIYVNGKKIEKKLQTTTPKYSNNSEVLMYKENLDSKQYSVYYKLEKTNYTNVDLKVKHGHFFAMGDNRDFSIDSRYEKSAIGQIPIQNIIASPIITYASYKNTIFNPKDIQWKRFFKIIK